MITLTHTHTHTDKDLQSLWLFRFRTKNNMMKFISWIKYILHMKFRNLSLNTHTIILWFLINLKKIDNFDFEPKINWTWQLYHSIGFFFELHNYHAHSLFFLWSIFFLWISSSSSYIVVCGWPTTSDDNPGVVQHSIHTQY